MNEAVVRRNKDAKDKVRVPLDKNEIGRCMMIAAVVGIPWYSKTDNKVIS